MTFSHFYFAQLDNYTLFSLLKLRSDVFVVEQQCVYPDIDYKDIHPQTLHLLAREGSEVIAYARVLAPGQSYQQASIGRVVVAANHRGKGLAEALMREACKLCQQHWPDAGVQIGAQVYLQGFYQQLNFVPVSDIYDEDGIDHIDMCLQE